MKCLQQLAYDLHISAMSITNTFTGTANTSVVCCLHSSILFEISENKEAIFFPSKFKVAQPPIRGPG